MLLVDEVQAWFDELETKTAEQVAAAIENLRMTGSSIGSRDLRFTT